MSDGTNVKELLDKVEDTDLRQQLEQVFGDLSGSALRQQLDEIKNENKTLKAEKRQRVYGDAGIPESAYDVLDKVYDGELEPDKVREFAASKGFALGETDTGDGDGEPDAAQQRADGEQRLSQLNAGTIPARDPSIDDQMKQAEQTGDWDTFNVLAAQKLEAARAS